MERSERFWNPYLAGIALGLVLLSAFLVMGHGLGASGAANRVATAVTDLFAPGVVANNASMSSLSANGRGILDDWLVFELLGVVLGGIFGAYTAGRLKIGVVKGPRISVPWRLVAALSGGVLMGLAARAARGCTSGQALSGGAVMSAGSWVFMLSVFAGGYAVAWFVRKEWT